MDRLKRKFYLTLLIVMAVLFAGSGWAAEAEKININTATVEQLTQLNLVGAKYAERIVQYREANGPFQKPEDIMKVKGIGDKTWEANKDRIEI